MTPKRFPSLGLRDPGFLQGTGSPYAVIPSDYPGLVRWYDAQDYADDGLADGAPVVNNWTDLSGVGDNAVPDGANAPHWRTAIMPSGSGCLHFPDGFHHFDITELTLGDVSLVLVIKPKIAAGAIDEIFFSSHSGNYMVRDKAGGSVAQWRPYFYPNAPPALENDVAMSNAEWYVLGVRRNGTTGVPTFSFNKIHVGDMVPNTNTTAMKIGTIGLYNGGLLSDFLAAEICIYNGLLSNPDMDALWDGYWSIKYAGDLGL